MFRFEKLDVWQKAVKFADRVYEASRGFPSNERYGLTETGFAIQGCHPEVRRGIWPATKHTMTTNRKFKLVRMHARFLGGPRNDTNAQRTEILLAARSSLLWL